MEAPGSVKLHGSQPGTHKTTSKPKQEGHRQQNTGRGGDCQVCFLPGAGGHTYFHVPPDEGLRDPQHVGVLHQFQQVLPQLLLVLGDFSQLHLELLQLLLQQHSCRESRLSRGSLLTPVTQAQKGHSAGKELEWKCASQGLTARFTSSSQFMVRTTTPAGCSEPSTCRPHMAPPSICCCQRSFSCLSTPHTNLYHFVYNGNNI